MEKEQTAGVSGTGAKRPTATRKNATQKIRIATN